MAMNNVIKFPSNRLMTSHWKEHYADKTIVNLLLDVAHYLAERSEGKEHPPEQIYHLFKTLGKVAYTNDLQKMSENYVAYAVKLDDSTKQS